MPGQYLRIGCDICTNCGLPFELCECDLKGEFEDDD